MRRLSPRLSREEIEEIYQHCLSLGKIVSEVGPCALEGVPGVEGILDRLKVSGVVLDTSELLDIAFFVKKIREIGTYFKKAEEKAKLTYSPVLGRWDPIPELYPLKKTIDKAIDQTGYIRDQASPRLKELRKKADRQKREIQTILERMIRSRRIGDQLTDQYMTIRNGRYVLPVKAGAKHAVQGIIHDQSQSRLTFFVEPIECVELNNALAMTTQEIEREEEQVRRDLSQRVAACLPLLRLGWQIITELDLIHARLLYMEEFDGVTVNLRANPGFTLNQVRHPLLLSQKTGDVIPIDLRLPEGKRVLILSGVNAGGKTVTLKSLGIVTLMVKAGLPVPAAPDGEIYPYEEVFTEIGDEQSITDDLSTFTAHIQHLKKIIDRSSGSSLVLIDEIGAGTGMTEGAALALGMLDVLARRQATVMVTTHFELLKGYGAQNPNAMNVSVAFDMEHLRPLFRLCYGVPGNSNAFETAKRYGIDVEVLTAAERYRQEQDRLLANLMADLEALKVEVDRERDTLADARREISRLRDQFRKAVEEITLKKMEILKKYQAKWDQQIKKQRQTFQEFMEGLKASSERRPSFHAFYSNAKGEFNRMIQPPSTGEADLNIPEEVTSNETISVGDEVVIPSVGTRGHVAGINPRQGTADVMVKGLRMQVSMKKLRKSAKGPEKRPSSEKRIVGVDVTTEAKPELNVVGFRVQEALPEVDKFIDAALVHRLKEVTIIHGIGTGRLRKAIHEYLANHEGIVAFDDGDVRRGGRGITVVRLP